MSFLLTLLSKATLYYKYFGIFYKLAKSVVITIEEELTASTGPEKYEKSKEFLRNLIEKSESIEDKFDDLEPIWGAAVTSAVEIYNVVGKFQKSQ